MTDAAAPRESPARVSSPRSAGAFGRVVAFVVVTAVAASWVAAGRYGLTRSREALTPVRELRTDLHAERSGGGVFSYAARAGATVLLFDAAADPAGRPLTLLLGATHAEQSQVAGIWITSARPDHLGGANAFPSVPLFMGDDDLPGPTGRPPQDRIRALYDEVLRLTWSSALPSRARGASAGPWSFVDGEKTHHLRAWPTPGPTPGSVSYLYDDVLFTGDLLSWRDGKLALPPRALDDDPAATRRSLALLGRELASLPLGLVCTGHGGCTPEGQGAHAFQQLLATLAPPSSRP